jgi:hypothetical protein
MKWWRLWYWRLRLQGTWRPVLCPLCGESEDASVLYARNGRTSINKIHFKKCINYNNSCTLLKSMGNYMFKVRGVWWMTYNIAFLLLLTALQILWVSKMVRIFTLCDNFVSCTRGPSLKESRVTRRYPMYNTIYQTVYDMLEYYNWTLYWH